MKRLALFLFGGILVTGSLSLAHTRKANEVLAETPNGLENDFSYSYDYTKYKSYSMEWKNDAYEANFMTISPELSALGVGQEGVACDGQGYVTYKYEAPRGKVFASMETHWTGRVFHNNEGECQEGKCKCGMDVLVSSDNKNFTNLAHENPSIAGTQYFGFKHDLTEGVRQNSTIYVKFLLNGKNWDWVNMTSLKIYGRYCDSNLNVSSVNTHNVSNTRIQSGEEISVDVNIANKSNFAFNGYVTIKAPDKYFDTKNNSSVSFNATGNSITKVSVPLTLKQAGYTDYYVCVYDNFGELYDQYRVSTFARGQGEYRFDTHSHSFISDGRNSLTDNYNQAFEKHLSGCFSTDHNAPVPGDDTYATEAVDQINKDRDADFVAFRGSELTASGNFHILSYNFKTEYPMIAAQNIIDGVINEGGISYLAHPFLPGYSDPTLQRDQTNVDALNNMTGIEIFNYESTVTRIAQNREAENDFDEKNLEYWDRLNITGKKKFFGTCGSDAHDSIYIGSVVDAFQAKDLTKEDILDAFSKGRFYVTTGPQLDFKIGGKTFGESLRIQGTSNSNIHIEAYDPDYPISKVVLYKFKIDKNNNDLEFTNGRQNAQVLYEQGQDKIFDFKYDAPITVEEDTFYRVELFTEHSSLGWTAPKMQGFAYSNPIFVEKEIKKMEVKSNPTVTSTEQYGAFNFAGLEIEATFYDDTKKIIKGFTVTGQDSSKRGTVTVHFEYEGYKFDIDFEILEQQGVVRISDGNIDFYRDYTKYEAYATTWSTDPAIDSIGGSISIGANAAGLGVGTKNVSSTGSGFVTYRIDVGDGFVVNKLNLEIVGRIYHSSSNVECAAGECNCYFRILVSEDGGCNYNLAHEFDLDKDGHSTWNQQFNFNLDTYVGNSKCVLVRIEMSGKNWDWICMQSVRLTGKYIEGESIEVAEKGSILVGGGNIRYEKDYTSYKQYETSWMDEKAVYRVDGNLTISPSTRCLGVGKQNVSSTGSGSVSYLVDLPEGNIFNTLTFSSFGRIYHSNSNAECAAGECNCGFKIYISVDGGYIYKEVYNEELNHNDSKFDKTVTVDLAPYIENRGSAIIKMYMSGKSWDWIGIKSVAINGTYKEGIAKKDAILVTEIDQDFSTMGVGNDDIWQADVYSSNNVCIGKGDKPWLSVDANDGSFNKTGELVYKLNANSSSFADLNINGNARVFTYEGSKARFDIFYSFDGVDYTLLKSYSSTTNGNEITNFNESLTDYIDGHSTVYIKIEMESGFWDWVCIKDLHILGYSVSNFIPISIKDNEGNDVLVTDEFVENQKLNLKSFAKPGYVVEGVYLDEACTIPATDLVVTSSNNEFYIKYEIAKYTIHFANSTLVDVQVPVNESYTLPTPDAPAGKLFDGWYISADFSGEKVTTIPAGRNEDLTLYAKFIDDPELIAYKEAAILELENYVNLSDYDAQDQFTISAIISNTIDAINDATDKSTVDAMLAFAKFGIDGYNTIEEKQLESAKKEALTEINNFYTNAKNNVYSEETLERLETLKDNAIASVNSAISVEQVNSIVSTFKTDVNKLPKILPVIDPPIDPSESTNDKKGCGGSVLASSILVVTISLIAVAFIAKRREENN